MSIFWRVLINRLKGEGHDILCLAPAGDAASEALLESFGTGVINYPLNRKGLNPLEDYQSFLSLKKIFMSEKPDLVFASTIKPVIYGLPAARQARVPAVFAAITGLGYAFEKDSLLKKFINMAGERLYKHALSGANGVFFQNKFDRELFIQRGIIPASDKIRLARGAGVDTERFQAAPLPETRAKGGLVFLFIGRLLQAKGLFEYEKAAEILRRRWPNARFQILGPLEEGPGSISAETLDKWRAKGDIEYLGSSLDVRPYIKEAHAIVLPSWREGTPTAILEAMSMGRACVASDAPGCTETVIDGVNGFLCKVKDPESLAQAMEKFLVNPGLFERMGGESRKMAVSLFDAAKVAEGMTRDMRELSPAGLWPEKDNT